MSLGTFMECVCVEEQWCVCVRVHLCEWRHCLFTHSWLPTLISTLNGPITGFILVFRYLQQCSKGIFFFFFNQLALVHSPTRCFWCFPAWRVLFSTFEAYPHFFVWPIVPSISRATASVCSFHDFSSDSASLGERAKETFCLLRCQWIAMCTEE